MLKAASLAWHCDQFINDHEFITKMESIRLKTGAIIMVPAQEQWYERSSF